MRLLTNYVIPGQTPSVSVMTDGSKYFIWRVGEAPQMPNGPDVRGLWAMRWAQALTRTMAQITFANNLNPGLSDAALLGIVADHLEQTNGNAEALADVKAALAKLTS